MATPKSAARKPRKKDKKNIAVGQAHIKSTFNNTIVSITDPSGAVISWASSGKTQVPVTLPKSLPSGEYLLRAEHIALHSAGSSGGAQFYISCAQIKVNNGGSGSPSPLVSFPGAYKASDAGILVNIYYPIPTNYKPPGPAVWKG